MGRYKLGAWRNDNGYESSASVGGRGKAYDDDELYDHYKLARGDCFTEGKYTIQDAINNMLTLGRHIDDVKDEKQRIQDYFQAQAEQCQTYFKSRYKKYKGKFCE